MRFHYFLCIRALWRRIFCLINLKWCAATYLIYSFQQLGSFIVGDCKKRSKSTSYFWSIVLNLKQLNLLSFILCDVLEHFIVRANRFTWAPDNWLRLKIFRTKRATRWALTWMRCINCTWFADSRRLRCVWVSVNGACHRLKSKARFYCRA